VHALGALILNCKIMAANHQNVTKSNMKAFTPMGEKHLQKSDVSHLIACEVTGASVLRPTVVYLKPSQLGPKRLKYASLGQKLAIPFNMLHLVREEEPLIVEQLPLNLEDRKKGSRFVICLNTGRLFSTIRACANNYHISPELLNNHLRGGTKAAKGRRFRFPTDEEMEAIAENPGWKYTGELLPILPAGNKRA
jgi:hypothetical protein